MAGWAWGVDGVVGMLSLALFSPTESSVRLPDPARFSTGAEVSSGVTGDLVLFLSSLTGEELCSAFIGVVLLPDRVVLICERGGLSRIISGSLVSVRMWNMPCGGSVAWM